MTVESKRLFVAIPISDANKTVLAEWIGRLRESGADAKWVEPEGMHLTLKFLGAVEESRIRRIEERLEGAAGAFLPYDFRIAGIGFFPSPLRPRVVWAGVEDGGNTAPLAARLEEDLEPLGFRRENRPFHPHITLARLRTPKNADRLRRRAGEVAAEAEMSGDPIRDRAEKIVLYESRLTPERARYYSYAEFPLGG